MKKKSLLFSFVFSMVFLGMGLRCVAAQEQVVAAMQTKLSAFSRFSQWMKKHSKAGRDDILFCGSMVIKRYVAKR